MWPVFVFSYRKYIYIYICIYKTNKPNVMKVGKNIINIKESIMLHRYITVGYHLPFRHNELVHLPYIAVVTNTSRVEGEETILITEANIIVGLYPYSVFTNPMFLSTNSLSIVNTFFPVNITRISWFVFS